MRRSRAPSTTTHLRRNQSDAGGRLQRIVHCNTIAWGARSGLASRPWHSRMGPLSGSAAACSSPAMTASAVQRPGWRPSRHATPHEASSNIIRPLRRRFGRFSRNGARNWAPRISLCLTLQCASASRRRRGREHEIRVALAQHRLLDLAGCGMGLLRREKIAEAAAEEAPAAGISDRPGRRQARRHEGRERLLDCHL
jgi:hypothetical protein